MGKIPARLLILTFLIASPAVAQSSWLHPTDREYQYAIDSVYGEAAAGRENIQALEFIQRLPDGTNSYVSVRPPLACANLNAEAARRDLGHAPTAGEAKEACDGQLLIAVRSFSRRPELDRFLVIEHGHQEIKPFRSFYDQAHPVATDGPIASKEPQYAYLDLYLVDPDAAWDDEVTFVTASTPSQQVTLVFNFSAQVENEQEIASAAR